MSIPKLILSPFFQLSTSSQYHWLKELRWSSRSLLPPPTGICAIIAAALTCKYIGQSDSFFLCVFHYTLLQILNKIPQVHCICCDLTSSVLLSQHCRSKICLIKAALNYISCKPKIMCCIDPKEELSCQLPLVQPYKLYVRSNLVLVHNTAMLICSP